MGLLRTGFIRFCTAVVSGLDEGGEPDWLSMQFEKLVALLGLSEDRGDGLPGFLRGLQGK